MTTSPRAAAGIFLHSGFRTGSTWFWQRFRAASGTRAYYEPFHEVLARLDAAALLQVAPQRWASGHPGVDAPYFAEYREVLLPEGGVRFYHTRFAAEAYYDSEPDPPQALYLRNLIDRACDAGVVPVFGFCRSLGRVPWFRALGRGLNVVTWRNPLDQWASCRDQAVLHQNWYFLFRFVLFASFGARHRRFGPFFADLALPPAPEGIATTQLGPLLGYFDAANLETLFSIFLRVYMLDMLIALEHADYLVDLDALTENADRRRETAEALRDLTGLSELSFDDCALPRHEFPVGTGDAAHLEEALSFLTGAGAAVARAHARALPLLQQRLANCLERLRRGATAERAEIVSDEPGGF
jgi:hypothetical protein